MRWSIVGLFAFGLIAALSATVLVASLRAGSQDSEASEKGPQEVEILMAVRSLPAMSVVDSGSVATKTVAVKQAPSGYLSNPVQVVGRVLIVPVVEGQAFIKGYFATGNSGVSLAAAVPKGMRMLTLSLSESGAMEGLLYPGSLVDVLGSFNLGSKFGSRGQSETISMTLLRGIQVLAVEDRTIVSEADEIEASPANRRMGRQRLVSLMVTPEQAEMLQLAAEHGKISLTMRNPLDKPSGEDTAVSRSRFSEIIRRRFAHGAAASTQAKTAARSDIPDEMMVDTNVMTGEWATEVIRGGVSETVFFPLSAGQK